MNKLPRELLFFNTIYHEKIWGGFSLQSKLNKQIPSGKAIGESWELSAIPSFPSIVSSGVLEGTTLPHLFEMYGNQFTGRQDPYFPLLFKFIDSTDKLSVQVHPDDAHAQNCKWDISGKTECWYVVDAAEDAELITGFKCDVNRELIVDSLKNNTFETYLNRVPIKAGEIYFIPAGTVHAILGNSLIYEVQQSSDVTFRFYDWNRPGIDNKPRKLHIEEALQVVNMQRHVSYRIDPIICEYDDYTHLYRMVCRYFAIEEYCFIHTSTIRLTQRSSFQVVSVLNGTLSIITPEKSVHVGKGETTVIPFVLKDVSIMGDSDTHVIVTFIPEIQKDIIEPLLSRSISRELIVGLGGCDDNNDIQQIINK